MDFIAKGHFPRRSLRAHYRVYQGVVPHAEKASQARRPVAVNIAMTERSLSAAGSTSGIGLGTSSNLEPASPTD
jgi:hypothetical protein